MLRSDDSAAGQPRRLDYGFFGPDSPTWKVWTQPTALIGFQRSVVLEHFDPFLAAAVADQRGIYRDPAGRMDRTLAYFLTVAVGDSRTAIGVSDHLMKVHAAATGIEPISGKRYSANNPDSQLWIHVTGWHSVLKCYERYGPGPLSRDEERRYWAESVIAAELQTCKTATVPASRGEVREYFAQVRPKLCTSERANEGMHYLLRIPRASGNAKMWAVSRLMAPATIATLPKWMRELGNFDQPSALDAAILPATRLAMRAARNPAVTLGILTGSMPMTHRTMHQHLKGAAPEHAKTTTPAEAREHYGRTAEAAAS
ncbi:MAG: hypothetical protein JWQ81_824 [Amycolatopsis sp.]|jgi:uncharacterized protein (DUF2236 family)|uniref:oxygenase MpaB family protein n=1 Tax=Amycolatopsis sp. TaxID=37632 RepID=UPI00260AF31E|nr:oxygenase MpaB family protein [Amycolatopsis sp.]MCU1680085.1 hypothetical protein [Amycolatopsis sp.]